LVGGKKVVGIASLELIKCSVRWQEGSDSEEESNQDAGASRKPQKRARGKIQNNTSKELVGQFPDLSQSQSFASSYGCLSLLKKRRSGGNPLSLSLCVHVRIWVVWPFVLKIEI
jgi:hypothetical protein